MVHNTPVLVRLMLLIDLIPLPAPPAPQHRGRPVVYPERLFLKALVLMIVRRLPTVHAVLAVLDEPEMAPVRALLSVEGRYPARRTWERRLGALPATLPAQIAVLGTHLVGLLAPWANGSRAVALDSTPLRAKGGVWHQKDRAAGVVPHTSIDTQAHWTKSGWHGWVYGWKLHLLTTVAAVWIPLAAELTPANVADNEQAPTLLEAMPLQDIFVLGDTLYNDPVLRDHCQERQRILVTTKRGAYPHTDDGVEVRRVFHALRSRAIENFNGQFKGIFDVSGAVPTRGLRNTQRFVLGAVLVYQLAVLHCFLTQRDLRRGLKPLLKAA